MRRFAWEVPPGAAMGFPVTRGPGSAMTEGASASREHTTPLPVTNPVAVGSAGRPTYFTMSTASFLKRFHAAVSPSSCAFSIRVSRENLPAAKLFTVGVRFSLDSLGESSKVMGASGESGSHAEPRPAETLRSTIRSRLAGREDQVVEDEMLFVRTRSTTRGSHWNAQGSVTRKAACRTFLPLSSAGENSK